MVVSVRRDSSSRPERHVLMSRRFFVPRGMRRGAFTAVAAVLLTSAAGCSSDDPASVATQDGTGDTAVAQDTGEPSDTAPVTVDAGNDAADSASATASTGVGLADGIGGSDPWQNTTASPAPGPIASNGTAGSLDDGVSAGDPFVTAPTEEAAEFLVDALRASSFRPVQGRSVFAGPTGDGYDIQFVIDSDGDAWELAEFSGSQVTYDATLTLELVSGDHALPVYARYAYTGYDREFSQARAAPQLGKLFAGGWVALDDSDIELLPGLCVDDPVKVDGCAAVNDHTEMIGLIKTAEIAGPATVDGFAATHVRFELDVSDMASDDDVLPPVDMPMHAWISNSDGLVRRFELDHDRYVTALGSIDLSDHLGIDDPDELELVETRFAMLLELYEAEQFVEFNAYNITQDIPYPPEGAIAAVSDDSVG